MKPRFWRASYLVWLIVPVTVLAVNQLYGVPHAIWSFSYEGGERGFGSRRFTSCTFIGPYGAFTVRARGGRCGWVAFFKKKEVAQ